MKSYKAVISTIFLLFSLVCSSPVFATGGDGQAKKTTENIMPAPPSAAQDNSQNNFLPPYLSFSSSVAYAENLWGSRFYSIDVANPSSVNVIASVNYLAFCSDFVPGDTQFFWIINYVDNSLRKVNKSNGASTVISSFPSPFSDGIWTCLSIHKSTGDFFAIATDGIQSILYEFDPYTGTILSEHNLGMAAAISSSFDFTGTLYVFDIDTDNIFAVEPYTGEVTEVGNAGFDGNYAQGMGFDPVNNEVYLAAYSTESGAQLRLLDRETGNTTVISGLPGETGAFAFPVETFAPWADAGSDATINENQSFQIPDATATNYSSLQWSTSGDGTFSSASSLTPVYTPGNADKITGSAELCLSAMPLNPAMIPFRDCLSLTINRQPSGLDFGDAPEEGGAFFNYPTTLAWNGAAHVINAAVFLGTNIDGEPDGQPNAGASGDDTGLIYPSPFDDEDGVTLPASAAMGSTVDLQVIASVNGYLDAWMDFDLDHSWFGLDEHIFAQRPLMAGVNNLSFVIPATAFPGQSYLRFRFRDYNQPISFDGIVNNGEVEDYTMTITETTMQGLDFGDAPDGDGLHFYPTLLAGNGARHQFVPGIHLGAFADVEPDGQPEASAFGDDSDIFYPSLGDDEDGVNLPLSATPGSAVNITVIASVDGFLDAWMDFNLNGSWADAGEHIFAIKPLTTGANALSFNIPSNASKGLSFLRFRFRTYQNPLSFDGLAENGEVEDYKMMIAEPAQPLLDFGDAPEIPGLFMFTFPTTQALDGAAHYVVPGIYLGSKIDTEADGQPSPLANGDDVNGIDDEDGVTLPATVSPGSVVSVSVLASVTGFLDAWMDFDLDGTWLNPAEHIFESKPLIAGNNALTFTVPDSANTGQSFLRFRFRDYGSSLSFTGTAQNGEVEDYTIEISDNSGAGFDFGDAPAEIYPTLLADDGARNLVDGVTFLGDLIDAEPDGISSPNAKGDDLDGLADEDGVFISGTMIVGQTAALMVKASVTGYLNAWFDFNQNGSWSDPEDKVFSDVLLSAGFNNLTFDIPSSSLSGKTFARFRFNTSGGLTFKGLADNGETEDYQVTIYPNWVVNPTLYTHIIVIPQGIVPLQQGDLLGVFYTDNQGEQQCGGVVDIDAGQGNTLFAFGDDFLTPDLKEGFAEGEPFTFKLFSALSGNEQDIEVTWDQSYPQHEGVFVMNGFSGIAAITGTQPKCELPVGWNYQVTGLVHSINIPLSAAPEIFGEPLEAGDWIGVFYADASGNEACGGAVQWNGTSGVVLNAYGDDPTTPEKDGFATGERLRWRLFDCNASQEYSAFAVYNPAMPCQGKFGDFCLSEIQSLHAGYTAVYQLKAGWNSISSHIVPYDPAVENMFASEAGKLIILKNLTSVYWPDAGVNTIGDWDNGSGYAVKVSEDFDLEVSGTEFAPASLTLSPGWHYLPVLSSCPVSADELFSAHASNIVIVQELIGTKVWWPQMGVHTLQTLEPGKAYKIKVSQSVTLDFPGCD